MEKVKFLVTGAKGFIGRNLISTLKNISQSKDKSFGINDAIEIFECDIDTASSDLEIFAKETNFVFHLAGINRPIDSSEFMQGNFGFTTNLLALLKKYNNKAPILMSSSIQASLQNDYGVSKKAGEDYLRAYGKECGVKTFIFRLPNVFGKWCKPNYNSAVATFCYNIANNFPITVNNENTELTLVYIDDVVESFLSAYKEEIKEEQGFYRVTCQHKVTLGHIVNMLNSFVASRQNLTCPSYVNNSFEKKLYSTFLSYLPKDKFSYQLKMNTDERGSFTEFIKRPEHSQVSVNISKPHIVKGNHWHHSKNEKFLVVSGQGVIRFRKVDEEDVVEYFVSGEKLEVVDIPTGYTHNIENLGDIDMVTIMWANELFNKDKPDTFFLEV